MILNFICWLILELAMLQLALSDVDMDMNKTCGKTKSCFSRPRGCDPLSNCYYFLSYALDTTGKAITFELLADMPTLQPSQYVAIGFSKDQRMGNDAVTYCVRVNLTAPPLPGLAYNPARSSQIISDPQVKVQVTLINSGTMNGKFWCKLSQQIAPAFNNLNVWSLNDSYYLLMATGTYTDGLGFGIHQTQKDANMYPLISNQINPTQFVISDVSTVSEVQRCVSDFDAGNLVKAHGILMVFGWWLFMATGILSARYFRTLWPNKHLFGSAIWFNLHRGLNAFGLLLVASAFICIFITACGLWSDSPDFIYNHSVVGMTASVCAFVQPLIAMVRCHPGTSKRPIFNWVHRIIGVGGFCCASAAIWLATNFRAGLGNDDGYGVAPRGMIIFYYVTIIIIVLCLESFITLAERLETRFNKVSNSHSGTPMSANHFKVETPEMRAGQSTKSLWDIVRIALLVIFVCIAIAITITLACFIGLK